MASHFRNWFKVDLNNSEINEMKSGNPIPLANDVGTLSAYTSLFTPALAPSHVSLAFMSVWSCFITGSHPTLPENVTPFSILDLFLYSTLLILCLHLCNCRKTHIYADWFHFLTDYSSF